jgi:thiol:disulfide interchange protein DsbD
MTLQGNLVDYLVVFSGGVLVSFTPCVYPLLPITIGYIGAKGAETKIKGFILSLIYVFGIAVTYSILGLIAALAGQLFGAISTHPLSYLIVGVIFILFGLAWLDIFKLSLPVIPIKKTEGKGFISVFVLGLVSGLIIGPCIAPALGAILAYIASRGNVLYGASLLFTFAYGMGFLIILAGTFSGLLLNLPKSGNWLLKVKNISGLILIIIGVYFILKAGRIIL